MRFALCLTQEHNLWLVGLAAVICLLGSHITFRLLQRLRHAEEGTRVAWTFMGAVATGATIWCTHFVAMIAYQPGIPVEYEPILTGVSLGLAIFGSALALWVANHDFRAAGALGGMIFGLAVTAMHYTGMQAFAVRGVIFWSAHYIAASIAGAVLFGALAFHHGHAAGRRDPVWAPAALMVLCIIILHFTAMAAIEIVPFAPRDGELTASAANLAMAFAVTGVGLLILGTALCSHALEAQSLAQARRRLVELLEGSVDGMIVEQDGHIVATNAAFASLAGVDHDEIVGGRLSRWIPDIDRVPIGALTQVTLAAGDQRSIPVEVALRKDDQQARPSMIYAVRDLRPRLAQERRIAHLARNDSLTGLPNRASFLEWLTRQTDENGPCMPLALLSIDLDRFKEVNDVHGHAAGDQLLITIAERMKTAIRPGEFVARLGGDEFVALMTLQEREDALELVDRLRDAVTAPVELDGNQLSCGLSAGVALWPQDAREISSLINNADLAMYRAKASLTTDVCFYEEAMDKAVRTRRRMVQELREALDQGHLCIHWQVQTAVRTGDITGYEALVRWIRDDGTTTSPEEFIPIAEQSGLILPIGEWVLRTACAEAAGWREPHKIAVNLSPVQLGHVDLPRLIHQILLETGLPPSRLELEITETAMIADFDRTTHVLRQIKALGVAVAMDDFGTGYSSLSTLRAFPFDKIKLDRSFMTELDGAPQSAAIIRAVLALGSSLDIPVLAEGVETHDQLVFLREQGCDEAQGYLLGRPHPTVEGAKSSRPVGIWHDAA
ncbi:bifunctional diguanylate cyclase/phosphodiesterase [Sphingomonas lycopersici]|uniref:EAL domain-containing protein n=3 Tax=Sphingomonas TaxID=13687 RepID=A0AA41Z7A2_9SPHN|nr:EAL domain-containing protein [Sphingomonas lycopersici]MCW6533926.1 EAL domain-containing protein [Sphingomonas lycopersici]